MKTTKSIEVGDPARAGGVRLARYLAFLSLCAVLLALSTRANTLTWTGGGGANANWNNSANWGGAGTPGNGDTLVFQGLLNLVNTNNIANLTLNQILFAGSGGFDLRGNAFTLTNSITATNGAVTDLIENNITLATSDTLIVVSNNTTLILEGILSGSVGVDKAGMGTLVYQASNTNSYTGTTFVSAGTLQLNVGGVSAFGGPLVIGDGSFPTLPTVQLLRSTEIPDSVPITIKGSGTLDLNNHFEIIGPSLTMDNGEIDTETGTLTLSPNTTITITNNPSFYGNLNLGSGGTLTLQGQGTNLNSFITFWANVSGSANIVLTNAASDWEGSNSYTGNITANAFSLVYLDNSNALGNTNNKVTINDVSEVALGSSINITNQSLTFNGGNPLAALYTAGPSTNSWTANFIVGPTTTMDIPTNCAFTLNGPIGGTGGLVKGGPGVMTLAGSPGNTYAGATTVSGGTLLLGKPISTTAIPGSLTLATNTTVRLLNSAQIYNPASSLTMSNSSLFDLAGFVEWVGAINLQGAQITSGAGTLYFSSNITVYSSSIAQSVISGSAEIWNGTYSITNSGHNYSPDLIIFADISSGGTNGGGLIKDGAGEVSLNGINTFTGPVTINKGSLWAATSTALGNTNTPVTVNSGATLFLSGNATDSGLKPLVLNGSGGGGPGSGAGALVCRNSNSWSGNITLASDSTIYPNPNSTLNLGGLISGPGSFIQAGPGTNILSGSLANTYAGITTVSAGTLVLNNVTGPSVPGNLIVSNSAVARLANDNQLTTNADVLVNSGGLLDLTNYFSSINTLRGSGTVKFGTNGWIQVGANNGTSEFDGTFTGAGFATGYTIGKIGTGTFTLTGTPTFLFGNMTIYGGRLVINGNQPQIPVLVVAGGTLSGTGTVGVVTGDGTISPGNSLGILSSSNVTCGGGNLFIQINGTNVGVGYAQLNVSGSVALGGAGLQLSMNTVGALSNQYTIINNDGADPVTGIFAGLPEGATLTATNGAQMIISYQGGTGNDVVLTQISLPTPPTFAGIQQLNNGSVQLNGVGISNFSYTIWANTNLTTSNWVSIGTASPPPNTNAFQFVDSNATNFSMRFYRISWP